MSRSPKETIARRAVLVIGVALLVTAGWVTWTRWPHSIDKGNIPAAASPRPTEPQAVGAEDKPSGRENLGLMGPVSLKIPSLGISAPIVPVTVGSGGALGVPADPAHVGWWSQGPPPGDPDGTAVIDGHVDWSGIGPGALFQLRKVKLGAQLVVDETGGPAFFEVVAVREYDKVSLPWQQIFDQNVQGRLVIVTCGGAFNYSTHHYQDNVVAYAIPSHQPEPVQPGRN